MSFQCGWFFMLAILPLDNGPVLQELLPCEIWSTRQPLTCYLRMPKLPRNVLTWSQSRFMRWTKKSCHVSLYECISSQFRLYLSCTVQYLWEFIHLLLHALYKTLLKAQLPDTTYKLQSSPPKLQGDMPFFKLLQRIGWVFCGFPFFLMFFDKAKVTKHEQNRSS